MRAHPNFPQDAPAALGPAQAAAQLEIEERRRKAQEYLHDQLLRTCAKVFYTECSVIPRSIVNPGTTLWRAIQLNINPDSESQVNSLRACIKTLIAQFKGEWESWIREIESVQTQLVYLGRPFSDTEFRECMYEAISKIAGWGMWVELQREARPPLTFYEIKMKGSAKWAELNKGNLGVLCVEIKAEAANAAFTPRD